MCLNPCSHLVPGLYCLYYLFPLNHYFCSHAVCSQCLLEYPCPFRKLCTWKLWVSLGGCRLSFLAQTGFVTSGSDLKCLHAYVGEDSEMWEYQKKFCFVLLSEAQTEILQKCVSYWMLASVGYSVKTHGVDHISITFSLLYLKLPPCCHCSCPALIGRISVWVLHPICAVHL